ncbi:response regulator [Paenibacillus sp. RC67]|uniref:response regulator n=1 Tax=Paenibacillus sp. RC67 TaxID=3039392 RepID=UPI0024ADEE73|nr:response regulator [Paenibacillus sp. RC67]
MAIIRVMLIDDDENALDRLEILLLELCDVAIIVTRYDNPLKALKELEATDVDVVFMDIQMPGKKRMETARKIKAMRPHTQVVFISSSSKYAIEAFEIGSMDYLLKPITKDRLSNTVSRIVKALSDRISVNNAGVGQIFAQCLGGFNIHTAHGMLQWKTNKEKELCAFLVHHGGNEVTASTIIESLWPESDLKKAKAYLYTCLSYLRKSFQINGVPASIEKRGGGYVISGNGMESDLPAFLALMETAVSEGCLDERQYRRMNALRRGDYLDGCDFQWAVWKQEKLTTKYIQALRIVYKHFMKSGNVLLAIDSLQRILELTPDSENDGRELIKLYLHADKRNEALKVFRQLDREVRGNMGVELESATVQLYTLIAENSIVSDQFVRN